MSAIAIPSSLFTLTLSSKSLTGFVSSNYVLCSLLLDSFDGPFQSVMQEVGLVLLLSQNKRFGLMILGNHESCYESKHDNEFTHAHLKVPTRFWEA